MSRRATAVALACCLFMGLVGCGAAVRIAHRSAIPAVGSEVAVAKTATTALPKPTKAPDYAYSLEELGSFASSKQSVVFQQGAALKQDGDAQYLIGPNGEYLLGSQSVKGLEYLHDGIYIVHVDKGSDINNTGLVSMDGGVLLPCEAAVIRSTTAKGADARFLEVVYATDKTDDQSSCFVRSSDNPTVAQAQGDVMYQGYAEVYDLARGKKIKGMRIRGGAVGFRDLCDAFTVQREDAVTLYDEDGKKLWNSSGNATVYETGIVEYQNKTYRLVDTTGAIKFKTKSMVTPTLGPNGYFRLKGKSGESCIRIDGASVLKKSYARVNYEAGGLFDVGHGADEKIVTAKGNTVVDLSSGIIREVLPGYCTTRAKGEHVLIASGEVAVRGALGDVDRLAIRNEEGLYYVVGTGEYTLPLSAVSVLDAGLVRARMDGSRRFGLFDLLTGKQLLNTNYEVIEKAGDYLFAFGDGTWKTYRIVLDER